MANQIVASVNNEPLRCRHLFGLQVIDPDRAKLHERIRVTGDKLANRAHKYLTLADEYNERKRFARDMANPPANVYPGWHTKRSPVKPHDPATRVKVLYVSPKLRPTPSKTVRSLYASPVAVVFNRETVGELRKVAPKNYVVHLLSGASVVESSRTAARAWITQQMGK